MDSTTFNNHLHRQLNFNLSYLKELIVDVEEDLMTHTPSKGLVNHPAFTVGHIITSYGMMIKLLGGENTVSKEWKLLFQRKGPGDPRLPSTDQKAYPTKSSLTTEITKQHQTLIEQLQNLSSGELNATVTWRYDKQFPLKGDLLLFMVVNHYAMHLGQLAAWRREMGLSSALAKL